MPRRCVKCGGEAAVGMDYANVHFCRECFKEFFEKKVRSTVLKYAMIKPDDRVLVAVSGGKDSSSLLFALRKVFPDLKIEALHINLGIKGYSEESEQKVYELVNSVKTNLILFDLEKELGISIEDFKNTLYRRKICSPCGVVKRYLINKIAYEKGFTKVATAHTLDDTAALLFNGYLHGDADGLVRLKPVLPSTHTKFVAKIKPLWEITDRECLVYAHFCNLPYIMKSCPLGGETTKMRERKEMISELSTKIRGFKHILLQSHTKRILPLLEASVKMQPLIECELCGMPSSERICAFCKRMGLIKQISSASYPQPTKTPSQPPS